MARTEAQRRTMTLVATILGSSLAFIDVTVVIIAMPTIETDLDLGLTGEQWIYLSYSLALAALYLVGGAVGDRYGRREVFMAAVAGFALASLLAAAAPNGGVLIAARTLQGIAGAFVTTNSLALLRETYGKEAGRAVGLWTSFTGVVTIAGPPVGGALVEWASWRWIFLLNLPVAVATIWFARAGRCRQQETARVGRLDIPGAVLIAVGTSSLTYALVEGADKGFAQYWWLFLVVGRGAHRVPRGRAPQGEPDAAARALQDPELRRRELGDVPRLRGARRLARLHRPVHPVPRLLALRDEPDPRADHGR